MIQSGARSAGDGITIQLKESSAMQEKVRGQECGVCVDGGYACIIRIERSVRKVVCLSCVVRDG